MVNFHDPAKVERDFITMLKLWHAVDGVYIWEYFITLDYEWSVIRGRRPYRWTIWVYSIARLTTLLAVIANMIEFDVTRPINCQALVTFEIIFGYVGSATISLLIVLRTIAIWNRKRIVMIIVTGTWLTNVSFFIEGLVRLRAVWLEGTCSLLNLGTNKPALLSTLSSDVIMLLTMLIGLLRMRFEGGAFGLVRLLWTQGVIWFFLDTVMGIPVSVFIFLNLNEPYNIMFQTPSLVVLSITVTRMYRSLTDFGSHDISPQVDFQSDRNVLEAKRIPIAPFSPNRMVHTTSEQYPAYQASHDGGVYVISTEGQLDDKPQGLGLGDAVESGGGK